MGLTLSPASLPAPAQGGSHRGVQAASGCLGWSQSPSPRPSSVPARLPFTIFQGGMPRASYGDRHCISVVHNGQQTAFDFTSRVIDFTVLTEEDPAAGRRASGAVRGLAPGRCRDASPSANKVGGPARPSQTCPSLSPHCSPFLVPLRPAAISVPLSPALPACSSTPAGRPTHSVPFPGSGGTWPTKGRSVLLGLTPPS